MKKKSSKRLKKIEFPKIDGLILTLGKKINLKDYPDLIGKDLLFLSKHHQDPSLNGIFKITSMGDKNTPFTLTKKNKTWNY